MTLMNLRIVQKFELNVFERYLWYNIMAACGGIMIAYELQHAPCASIRKRTGEEGTM